MLGQDRNRILHFKRLLDTAHQQWTATREQIQQLIIQYQAMRRQIAEMRSWLQEMVVHQRIPEAERQALHQSILQAIQYIQEIRRTLMNWLEINAILENDRPETNTNPTQQDKDTASNS